MSDPAPTVLPVLDDLGRDLLAFERLTWRFAGSKEAAIRERWGWTATEYYRRLDQLIKRPEALATEPVLVKRLRRLREQRRPWRRAG